MTPNLIFCILLGSFVACSDNKDVEEKMVSKTDQQQDVSANKETDRSIGDDIVGYWKLTLEAYDDNENKILDEEERKKGIKNKYTFRFNADGSCQIQETFQGRYEVKTENNNKILYVYRKRIEVEEDKDPIPDVYRIISMNKTQIVLLELESNLTFWAFEKAG